MLRVLISNLNYITELFLMDNSIDKYNKYYLKNILVFLLLM